MKFNITKLLVGTYITSSIYGGLKNGVPKAKEEINKNYYVKSNMNYKENIMELIGASLLTSGIVSVYSLLEVPARIYNLVENNRGIEDTTNT